MGRGGLSVVSREGRCGGTGGELGGWPCSESTSLDPRDLGRDCKRLICNTTLGELQRIYIHSAKIEYLKCNTV